MRFQVFHAFFLIYRIAINVTGNPITSFQSIANIKYTLDFFNDVFCTHIVFFTDLGFCFLQHFHCTIT